MATTLRAPGPPLTAPKSELFCPRCACAFPDWVKTCPVCDVELAPTAPPPDAPAGDGLSYPRLVELVREQGGSLTVPLSTVEVARAERWTFPYFGFGFAWAKRMEGELADAPVALHTRHVGLARRYHFPYLGRGYAWMRVVEGTIAGNGARLDATRVGMETEWTFPYFGFGYAWTREMAGACGEELSVRFVARDVLRDRKHRFPYLGYGFAWVGSGELIVSLAEVGD